MSGVPVPGVQPPADVWSVVLAGVGGSGTVTLSAVLGMAAHIDGLFATALDQTGLAQKFGAVTSYVRISASADRICAPRVPAGDADLLISSDSLVGTSAETIGKLTYGSGHAVVNADEEMPAAFIHQRDYQLPEAESRAAIAEVVTDGGASFVPAGRLSKTLVGDRIAATFFLLGHAWQRGLVPVREASLHEAIVLNGVAAEQNWCAFLWGRFAAHDLAAVEEFAGGAPVPDISDVLKTVVARRSAFLESYQSERYAHRYEALVALVEKVERERCGSPATPLADAVARNYFKLLAYKDEYEVARLYTDTGFIRRVRGEAGQGARLQIHLAPPLLSRPDPVTGRVRKHAFGSWVLVLFRMLRALRFLRGSPFDPFGYTAERRTERALIMEYERTVADLLGQLDSSNRPIAVKLASLPDSIRGFGHVKAKAIRFAESERKVLLEQFRRIRPRTGATKVAGPESLPV
jgi:indolepyruvate ferredoxin oxidoreductase